MSNGCSAKELVLWEVLLRNQSHPNRLCVFFWVYVLNTCSFGLRHSFVLTSLSKYYPLICWHYLQTQQGLHNVRHNQHHNQTVTMLGRSLMPFQSPLCSPPPTHLLTNYGSCIMCVNIRQCTLHSNY